LKKFVSLHPKNKEIHLASCQSPPPKRGFGEALEIYNYMIHKQLPTPPPPTTLRKGNFFKNNKVAVENVYMMPLFNPSMKYKLGKIHFDKYENSWIFDPIEECINTQAVDNYLKEHI
jgi:hypothetical protein